MRFLNLKEISDLTGGELRGDPTYKIYGVESLEVAGKEHASFLENPRYELMMKNSNAGVILVPSNTPVREGKNFILVDSPSLAFQKVIEYFLKPSSSGFQGIHPTAIVHPSAMVGKDVMLGPYVVVDQGVVIGDRTHILAHVTIGSDVKIGKDCKIHNHVVIGDKSSLGDRVIIQPGAVIGSSGFGFATDKNGKHALLPQLGIVVIEDDVEVGANTTIDRARFKETRIGKGTKIDNLVQIAHGVTLGENNLIVAQVGIAGSTKTGKNVVMAGQVGVVGHIDIVDNVVLAARSAVSKSILKGGIYSGAPAAPVKEFNEQIVHIRNLKKWIKRVEHLEKEIKK